MCPRILCQSVCSLSLGYQKGKFIKHTRHTVKLRNNIPYLLPKGDKESKKLIVPHNEVLDLCMLPDGGILK